MNLTELRNDTAELFGNYDEIFNNKTANASADEIDLYPLSLVIPFTIIYVIIFVTGVIGNVCTCVVIVKNKVLRTATNYYLFSLACSDMLLLLSGLPPEMYRIWLPNQYVFGQGFCIIQSLAAETSAYATVLTITAFTIERYLAICHPFFTQTMSKLSRAVRYIIAIWITAIVLAIPQAVQFGVVVDKDNNGTEISHCTVKNVIYEHVFEVSTFVIFVGPMTLITILYVLIGVKLKGSRYIASHRYSTSSSASQRINSKFVLKTASSQRRVVKMLIAVVIAFFVCWAPFHAQRLLAVYLSTATVEAQEAFFDLYRYLMYVSGMLYFVSTTVNPLLYHIMSKKFRKAFKETYWTVCQCGIKSLCYDMEAMAPLQKMQRSVSEGTSRTIFTDDPINLSRIDGIGKRSDSKISSSSHSSYISTSSRNNSDTGNHQVAPDKESSDVENQNKGKNFLPYKLYKMINKKYANKEQDLYKKTTYVVSPKRNNCSSIVENNVSINENFVYISNFTVYISILISYIQNKMSLKLTLIYFITFYYLRSIKTLKLT